MTDFLKAEWKTLVLVVLAAVAVYLLLVRESTPPESEARPPTVVPGEAIDGIALGTGTDALTAQLGEPSRVQPGELGLEVWHWDTPPLTISVYDGRATAIERHLDDGFKPRLEGGTVIGTSTQALVRDLGQPVGQFDADDESRIVRFRGLMVHTDPDEGLLSVTVAGIRKAAAAPR